MWTGKRSQHGSLDGSLDGSHGESLDRDQRLSPEETLHTQLALSQFHRYGDKILYILGPLHHQLSSSSSINIVT